MRIRGILVAALALTLSAAGRGINEGAPGAWDAPIARHLKHTLEVLRHGRLSLKNVAAEYYVEAEKGLTWKQALAASDKRFPDDPIKRALFVAHYVKPGMSADRLQDLGVPEAGGCSIGKAQWRLVDYTLGYHAHGFYSKDIDAAPKVEVGFRVNTVGSSAGLFDPVQGTIVSRGEVSLEFIEVGGLRFQTLTFDMDGRLTSFWQRPVPVGQALVAIMDGHWERSENFSIFEVSVYPKSGGAPRERIEFTQAVKMKEREVYDTETNELKYREIYEAGDLRQRLHYRDGDTITPWRTEEF